VSFDAIMLADLNLRGKLNPLHGGYSYNYQLKRIHEIYVLVIQRQEKLAKKTKSDHMGH
jgi:hypothetical protein